MRTLRKRDRSPSINRCIIALASVFVCSPGGGTATTLVATTCSGPQSGLPTPSVDSGSSSAVVVKDVPAYSWHHGCSPTTTASLFGYWDINGYPDLFDAAGADVFLTANVRDQISSPAHNAKYDPTPDAPGPAPEPDSIAGFMGTSVDPLAYGATWVSSIPGGSVDYAAYRGYDFDATLRTVQAGFSWSRLVEEIDARRPLHFVVDWTGDGRVDHSVPAIGYDDRGALGRYYGFYTTWSKHETVEWRPFEPIGAGVPWGVYSAITLRPVSAPAPVPVPASLLLLGSAFGILAATRAIGRRSAND